MTDDQMTEFYQAARSEVVQRLRLRDQALFAYIVTAGVYIGFLVQPNLTEVKTTDEILLGCAAAFVLPILSLVFTYVILQHHSMIGKLGDYVRSLYPDDFNHWDNFYLNWTDRGYLTARTASQAFLLVLPICYTGVFFILNNDFILSTRWLVWAAGFTIFWDTLVVLTIIRLHVVAYKDRRKSDFPKTTRGDGVSEGKK